LFVFFFGEVREFVDGQSEFVSVQGVVKIDILSLFLPDGISHRFFSIGVVLLNSNL